MRRKVSKFINSVSTGPRRERTAFKRIWNATPHNERPALKEYLIERKIEALKGPAAA